MPISRMVLKCSPDRAWVCTRRDGSHQFLDGHALIHLALDYAGSYYDAGMLWLKDYCCKCLEKRALSLTGEITPTWSKEEVQSFMDSLPWIIGYEYVDECLLEKTHLDILQSIEEKAASFPEGVSEWFSSLGEEWALVGKIIFHLAELTGESDRPFAFLATYAHKLNKEGKAVHTPLGRVLNRRKEDPIKMESLILSLRQAVKTSPWLCRFMEEGRLLRAEALKAEEAHEFLREAPLLRSKGIMTRMPAGWQDGKPSRVVIKVKVGHEAKPTVAGRPAWDFDSFLALDGIPLTQEEWEKIRTSPTGLISLRGKWVEVDQLKLSKLLGVWDRLSSLFAQGITFSQAVKISSGSYSILSETGKWEKEAVNQWTVFETGNSLKTSLERLKNSSDYDYDPSVQAELRPYQKQGINWLYLLWQWGAGACLADDMGLGKTLQLLAFLSFLKKKHPCSKPSLLVAPASLLSNWMSERAQFTPHLECILFHSSREKSVGDWTKADLVITTYSYLHSRKELKEQEWNIFILDEAQNVKNPDTLQAKAAVRIKAEMKIALTGTPIENGLTDLWSIMNITNPGLLGDKPGPFLSEVGDRDRAFSSLKRLVTPFLLRRMKKDKSVALSLPARTEVIQRAWLTRRQAVLYAHLTENLKKELFSSNSEKNEVTKGGAGSPILKYLLKFKQVCNHPSLLNGDHNFDENEGGKFLRLGELTREWADRQEKILVFTQFREMCFPLAQYLERIFGCPGLVMHGGTPLAQRARDVSLFQTPEGPPFYVLSVKTAGTGLTLTAASHVVHFDRWWNPAVEDQASDRAYRIGQDKPVFIHKFMVLGTFEEKIDRIISNKKEMAGHILERNQSIEGFLKKSTVEELISLFSLSTGEKTDL